MSTSTDRERLFGDRDRRQPAENYGSTAKETLANQRQTIQAQDEELGQLSVGVNSVRNIAGLIHSEVNQQNVVLDAINGEMNDTGEDVATTGAKLGTLGGSTYNFRNFCLLLWPLVLLIVLLVEAIVHFIF